jgi:hypothetical protein
MPARRDVELGRRAVQEHRRNHRHVRQMRAAVVRRVEHEHVAGLHRAAAPLDDRFHAFAHRAEMHGHVRRIGDQVAVGVEQRARGRIPTYPFPVT